MARNAFATKAPGGIAKPVLQVSIIPMAGQKSGAITKPGSGMPSSWPGHIAKRKVVKTGSKGMGMVGFAAGGTVDQPDIQPSDNTGSLQPEAGMSRSTQYRQKVAEGKARCADMHQPGCSRKASSKRQLRSSHR